jgi:acyl-CoA thioesterase FadM
VVHPDAPESRAVWSMHQTDANQIIYTNAYLARAEDHFAQLVHAAGLSVRSVHAHRVRMSFKRAFMAGQEYVLRGRLCSATESGSVHGVIAFHSVEGQAQADVRPAVIVRFDATAGPIT